jgi:hypothetical protein
MNQLLFDRSTGSLGPQVFARVQTSALLRAIQPAPRLRFHGGEKEASLDDDVSDGMGYQAEASVETRIWAHQAGVNALGLDIEGRMYEADECLFSVLTIIVSFRGVQTPLLSSGILKSLLWGQNTRSDPPVWFKGKLTVHRMIARVF